jgi:hypothetical protein
MSGQDTTETQRHGEVMRGARTTTRDEQITALCLSVSVASFED